MKHKLFTGISMMLIVLLAFAHMGSAITPNELEEGQEFTFSVDAFDVRQKVNGTDYADPLAYRAGDTVDVAINNIGEDTAGTFVEVTETLNDETTDTTSYLDDWSSYWFLGVILVAFGTAGFPNNINFGAITNPSDLFDTGDSLFPFFATSNESYYKQLDSDFETVDDDLQTSDPSAFTQYTVKSSADYDSDKQIFTLSFSWDVANSTTNADGKSASFSLSSLFDLEIDVSRSLVTKMVATTSVLIEVADASKEFAVDIQVSEDGGFFGFLSGVPGPSFYLSLLALFLIIPITRRRA